MNPLPITALVIVSLLTAGVYFFYKVYTFINELRHFD